MSVTPTEPRSGGKAQAKLTTAYLFQNGMVMAFNQFGRQMPEFQDRYSPELGRRIAAEGVKLEGAAWPRAEDGKIRIAEDGQ